MPQERYIDDIEAQNRDASRGIENVKAVPSTSGYESNERMGPREREFLERESLESRAYRKRKKAEDIDDEVEEGGIEEFVEEAAQKKAVALARSEVKRAVGVSAAKTQSRRVVGFARWGGLGFVWTAYVWQFIFAIASLVGFSLHAMTLYVKEETLFGKILGYFIDFEKYLPGEYLGVAFWGLCLLLVIGVFLVLLLQYFFMGIKIFQSVSRAAITLFALTFSMIPILNLLPWLPLWAIYMNTASLFTSDQMNGGDMIS